MKTLFLICLFPLMAFAEELAEGQSSKAANQQKKGVQKEEKAYEKKLASLENEVVKNGSPNLSKNLIQTLKNYQCEKTKNAPELILACDYPKVESKRGTALCHLIDPVKLTVVATASVSYGRNGLIDGVHKPGSHKTPLGLFDLNMKAKTKRKPNQFGISMFYPMEKDRSGLGPIIYSAGKGGKTSFGSPVISGKNAQIFANKLAETNRVALLNSSEDLKIKNSCKQ